MIFDTHCHGYWHGLVHRQAEVRNNMRAAGVVRSVHIGTDLAKNIESRSRYMSPLSPGM